MNAADYIKVIKPFDHQQQAFEFSINTFNKLPGVALLMEMGTGKTVTSIAVIGYLLKQQKIKNVLIVAPLSVLGVWEQELTKYANYDFYLHILKGSSTRKVQQLNELRSDKLNIVIVNYESTKLIEQQIIKVGFDLVLCDEGHKIKNHAAAQSKSLHRISAWAKYRMLLTGTLITNKALDVFSQYKFLAPAVFGNSFYSFRSKYFYMTGYGNYTPVLKPTMEQELMQKVHSIAYRATKDECLDLPETMEVKRYFKLEPAARKIYDAVSKESFAEFQSGEITTSNVLTKILRLSQVTGGFVPNDDGTMVHVSEEKLNALTDIVDDICVNENKKLVIIAQFRAELDAITKMLKNKKLEHVLINGDVTGTMRSEYIDSFQNDPNCKVFVGQIGTASLGITLTAACDMVFYSMGYNLSDFEQVKARTHRSGQRHKCTYIYLLAKNTIDEKVLVSMEKKQGLARAIVDDYRLGFCI